MATDINLSKHPIRIVRELRQKYGNDLQLSFARYKYLRKDRKELRESFWVPIHKVTYLWLRKQIRDLEVGYELALESRIKTENKTLHMPMLDFQGMNKRQLEAIVDGLSKEYSKGMRVYFSGRSFHAYYPHLVSRPEWVRFMGSALLCNLPGKEVIDQRWVGHRLLGGYASLRWSCNTLRHEYYPSRVPTSVLSSSQKKKIKLRKKTN